MYVYVCVSCKDIVLSLYGKYHIYSRNIRMSYSFECGCAQVRDPFVMTILQFDTQYPYNRSSPEMEASCVRYET